MPCVADKILEMALFESPWWFNCWMILSRSLSLNPSEDEEGEVGAGASLGGPARPGFSLSGSPAGIAARVKIATKLQRCRGRKN